MPPVLRALALLAPLLAASPALAQTVAFVAPGEAATDAASQAVLRFHQVLDDLPAPDEAERSPTPQVKVLASLEVRRALAGLPAQPEGQDDPLSDIRDLVRRARGDRTRQSLGRLGERLGVDLLITVRQVGGELELRGFNVERSAFYRGTLMVSATQPPEGAELAGFVQPRVRALAGSGGEATQPAEARPRRRRVRWWIWAIVGGAVAAAALVGYLVQPDEVEDRGVTLRIVAP